MSRIKLVFKTNLNELFQAVLACGAFETIFLNFFSSESITVLPGWYLKKTDWDVPGTSRLLSKQDWPKWDNNIILQSLFRTLLDISYGDFCENN